MKSGKILANFPLSMYYYVTSLCRQEECIHLLGKPFCFSLPCQLGSPMKRKNLLSVDCFIEGEKIVCYEKINGKKSALCIHSYTCHHSGSEISLIMDFNVTEKYMPILYGH